MKTFALTLFDTVGSDRFDEVVQFIGADSEGSFGLLAGHIHTVAVLRYGLARFSDASGVWRYLAVPGGVLRFADNRLTITTMRYFLGEDRDTICERLETAITQTDSEISMAKTTLSGIENLLLKRLAELANPGRGSL